MGSTLIKLNSIPSCLARTMTARKAGQEVVQWKSMAIVDTSSEEDSN